MHTLIPSRPFEHADLCGGPAGIIFIEARDRINRK